LTVVQQLLALVGGVDDRGVVGRVAVRACVHYGGVGDHIVLK